MFTYYIYRRIPGAVSSLSKVGSEPTTPLGLTQNRYITRTAMRKSTKLSHLNKFLCVIETALYLAYAVESVLLIVTAGYIKMPQKNNRNNSPKST